MKWHPFIHSYIHTLHFSAGIHSAGRVLEGCVEGSSWSPQAGSGDLRVCTLMSVCVVHSLVFYSSQRRSRTTAGVNTPRSQTSSQWGPVAEPEELIW